MSGFRSSSYQMGDPTIHCVLDGIASVSQVDPSWIQPDHSLSKDPQLSAGDILRIAKMVSEHLNLKLTAQDEAQFCKTATPREMVQKIESFLDKKLEIKAG